MIFVDGRYQVQVQEEIDGTIFSVAHVVENPPTLWIENNLPAQAKLGYSPWLHTVESAERLAKACAAGARHAGAGRRQSDRHGVDRPAAAAARRRDASAPCRRRHQGQAQAPARRDGKNFRRRARGLRPAERVVAVQYPRQRRAAHAGGAGLRHGAESGADGVLCRPAQARQRHAFPSRGDCRSARQRRLRARSGGARQGASRRAARSRDLRRGDRALSSRTAARSTRQRSDRADEGGQERHPDRRRPRGATARRRRGDEIFGLVRPRGAPWPDRDSTRSRRWRVSAATAGS